MYICDFSYTLIANLTIIKYVVFFLSYDDK